jgi:hypothetical protein
MPLSVPALEAIREAAFAEDVPITDTMTAWTREQAVAYFESGGSAAPTPMQPRQRVLSTYRVMHKFVNVRSIPALTGKVLEVRTEGATVLADARGGPNLAWIRLSEKVAGATGWLLTDGRQVGMSQELLRLESGPLPPDESGLPGEVALPMSGVRQAPMGTLTPMFGGGIVRLAACMTYEVIHPFVRVRASPSATSAEAAAMKRKGTLVSVCARCGDWVQLDPEPGLLPIAQPTGLPPPPKESGPGASSTGGDSGWMLIDGRSMSPPLGELLRPHIVPLAPGTQFRVTRESHCVGYPSPAGSSVGETGSRLPDCAHGDTVDVLAECGMWVQVRAAEGPMWVEMDAFLAG